VGSGYWAVCLEFKIQGHAAAGDLAPVVKRLTEELAGGATPFADAREFEFTTSTAEIRQWLSHSARMLSDTHPPYPGLYMEMNSFDINTDEWSASVVAMSEAPDPTSEWWPLDDLPPLAPDLVLSGSEAMQDAFHQWRSMTDTPQVAREVALAQWLVWAKWLMLLQSAWREGPLAEVRVPVVATAHDFVVALFLVPDAGA